MTNDELAAKVRGTTDVIKVTLSKDGFFAVIDDEHILLSDRQADMFFDEMKRRFQR